MLSNRLSLISGNRGGSLGWFGCLFLAKTKMAVYYLRLSALWMPYYFVEQGIDLRAVYKQVGVFSFQVGALRVSRNQIHAN